MKIQNIKHRKFQSLGKEFNNLNLIEHPHDGLIALYSNKIKQDKGKSEKIFDYFVSYFDVESQEWNNPQLALRLEINNEISSSIFLDLKGNLQIIFDEDDSLKNCISNNYGLTWNTPKVIFSEGTGWKLKNKPNFIGFGRIVLPVYNILNGRSFALITDDHGLNWFPSTFIELSEDSNDIIENNDNYEDSVNNMLKTKFPAFIQRGEKEIISFMQIENAKVLFRASSDSYGETWTDAIPAKIPSSSSSIDAILLRDDSGDFLNEIFIIYIKENENSQSLVGSFSNDYGETWFGEIEIFESDKGKIDNPSVVQSKNNRIHVIFSINNDTIQHSELELQF